MFIGHFAVAFAAKRVAPRTSLGTTFVAAQFADLVWPIFLLLGIEHVEIARAPENLFLNLNFTSYPWSHSLLMELVLGIALGASYWAITRNWNGAIVVALLVPSHWVLDLVVHIPDLPLYPGATSRLGFGLWHHPTAVIIIESMLMLAGVAVYVTSTTARDRIGRWGLWSLVVFLVVMYAASIASPPPPTVQALAWVGLVGWPLTLWPWWVDRHHNAISTL